MQKYISTKWIGRLLFPIVLLSVLIFRLDKEEILRAILSADIALLLWAAFLFAIPIPLRAWRWQTIMKASKIHCTWRDAFLFYLVGYAGQFFLPTGLGDTIRIFYLIEDGHSSGTSLATVIKDKLSDYFSYLAYGLLGFFIFPAFEITGNIKWVILVFMIFSAFIIVFLLRHRLQNLLRRKFNNLVNKQITRLALKTSTEVWRDLRETSLSQAFIWGVVSLLIALIHNLSFYLISLSLGLQLSYLQVLGIAGILNMILSTPIITISVGGFGIREGILLTIFSILGRSAELAISFSFLIFAISIFWHITALLAWMFRPINFNDLTNQLRDLVTPGDIEMSRKTNI